MRLKKKNISLPDEEVLKKFVQKNPVYPVLFHLEFEIIWKGNLRKKIKYFQGNYGSVG